jgi:hypothetical protein
MLHGRLVGGLLARAIETGHARAGFRAARLTVDLFRPAALAPVEVSTSLVRDGRRIRVADAVAVVGGHEIARASCVLLATSADPPAVPWRPEPWVSPHPDTLATANNEGRWEFVLVDGAFQGLSGDHQGPAGRSRIWTRETAALVAGEPLTPFVRAAVSADIASPLANATEIGVAHINADYSLALARYPTGEWVGVEATQQQGADGISIATCTLYDTAGPFATSTAVALANPPLTRPE